MAYSIDLSGRVALVTGASSGLGAQAARVLARAGAAVVLCARRVERLKDLRAQIEGEGGDAHVIAMDVTDTVSIRAAVAHAETEVGSIDILVNCSGVGLSRRLQEVSEEDYDRLMNTNLRGAFFVAQEVAKRMLARAKGAAVRTAPTGQGTVRAKVSATSKAHKRAGGPAGPGCRPGRARGCELRLLRMELS